MASLRGQTLNADPFGFITSDHGKEMMFFDATSLLVSQQHNATAIGDSLHESWCKGAVLAKEYKLLHFEKHRIKIN